MTSLATLPLVHSSQAAIAGAAECDPFLVALDRYRAAIVAYAREGRTDDWFKSEAGQRVSSEEIAALKAVERTQPTSLTGITLKAAFLLEMLDQDELELHGATADICRGLVAALAKQAGLADVSVPPFLFGFDDEAAMAREADFLARPAKYARLA